MRPGCFLAALVASVAAVGPLAAGEFPYTAMVTAEDVYVRSGPGSNYYPTDKLQRGDKVEVYRQDPGGWCAIRPPGNSFSWVAAQKLNRQEDGLAAAAEEHVPVHVGSALSDLRDVIQVRLDRREQVEVLSAPDPDDRSGSGWYKISPPAGEFRWISVKYLQRTRSSAPSAADDERGRRAPAPSAAHAGEAARSRSTAATGRPASAAPAASSPARELNRLDIELSAIVAEDVSAWSFDDLKRRAEAVLDDCDSSVERGRARLLLGKLARFEDIKLRYDQLHRPARAVQSGVASLGAPVRPPEPRFDGSGRLTPVVSSKAGAPTYALVDGNGAVTHFITPAPGVNLRPFVNKQVGVNGQRSYMTDTQKQVISVQHVAVIEGNRTY